MKTPLSFLNLTKTQRREIYWTLTLFLLVYLAIIFFPKGNPNTNATLVLDSITKQQLNALVASKQAVNKDTIYPFNPNYFTDFKAHQLGISMDAVYRIRAYRKSGKYINSEKTFQKLTQLSETEIAQIGPYLKWTKSILPKTQKLKKKRIKKELNAAIPKDLQLVYGIGEVFANRIISIRNQLGGFVIKDQINDVWGLSSETQQRLWNILNLTQFQLLRSKT